MNSTETPGGARIPAGWYDDPSGGGLRWWDGERWTEHVHAAQRAAAEDAGAGDEAAGVEDPGGGAADGDEGAPPRDLVKLREAIRAHGAKAVGMLLGALVLVIVVIALLLSGGSDGKGGGGARVGEPGVGSGGGHSLELGD